MPSVAFKTTLSKIKAHFVHLQRNGYEKKTFYLYGESSERFWVSKFYESKKEIVENKAIENSLQKKKFD